MTLFLGELMRLRGAAQLGAWEGPGLFLGEHPLRGAD